ncbi:MAG TPA: caspase family protein, partial [Pseudomonadales bacterium]
MPPRKLAVLTILLCACGPLAVAAEPAVPTAGATRALLIGINQYKSVPPLQGSVNDVSTMREVLMTRWNFSSSNIEMVLDGQATRANILAALNRLVSTARPDEVVYVHYSGHGSQVQDLNGDESDGLDETIVPQDGRGGDVPDIVDDELDVIFSKLRAKSAVIVLDSCHSGTATRAFDVRTRSVPQDTRVDLYRTGVTATSTRAITPLQRSRFVVMSGAADNEEALDGPVEGRYHGFFTYALSRSFTSAQPSASPRQIFAGVAGELRRIQTSFGRTSMPEPQLEAPPASLDLPLFARAVAAEPGTSPPPRLAWLTVRPAGGGGVTLVNGVLLGGTPGSSWAIYPPNEVRFAPGRALAVATVTAIDGTDARAQIISGAQAIEPESRAVALMPAPASSRIAMRMGDVPADRRQQIKQALSNSIAAIEWVDPPRPARFLVDMQGGTVRLLTADGSSVVGSFALGDQRSIANIARIASRTAAASELLALDNRASRLQLSVQVVGAAAPATRAIRLGADTEPA